MLTARREEIEWVHSNKVYESVPMQNCSDAGKKLLDLIWVDTDNTADPAHKKFRSTLCASENKTKKQVKIQGAFLASQLFTAMPPLEAVKVLVSITISVSCPKNGKPIEVEALRHQLITCPRNSP